MRKMKTPWIAVLLALLLSACGSGSDGEIEATSPPDETGTATEPADGETAPGDAMAELEEAALAEGAMTWYTVVPAEPAEAILNAFGERYPELDLTLTRLSPGPLLETLLADYARGDVQADAIMFSSILDLNAAVGANAVAEFVPQGADELRDDIRMGEPHGVALYLNPYTWIFRTDLPPEIVDRFREGDWEMFNDPEVVEVLRGKVASGDPVVAGAPANSHITLLDAWGEDRYWDWLENTFRPLEPTLFDSNVPASEAVASGEAVAALISQSFAIGQIAEGVPAETVYFDPTPAYTTMTSKAADAPHPAAAELFIEWLVSEEGQTVLEREYNTASAREGWTEGRAHAEQAWYEPDAPQFSADRLYVADESFFSEIDREEFIRRWAETMGR